MQLHVGQAALRGDIARYARRFDMVELRAEPGKLPRGKQLAEWARSGPERYVFSVVLPRSVAALDSPSTTQKALEYALDCAKQLNAGWILLQTPPTVMPSARTRKRLQELVEKLTAEGRRVAWDPRGVWQEEETDAIAEELGVCVVRDLSRQPPAPGEVAYCRLQALGEATRVRAGAIEQVCENLAEFAEAFVVIEGEGAPRAAQMLREFAGEMAALAEEDDDTDDEDEDGFEDEDEDKESYEEEDDEEAD